MTGDNWYGSSKYPVTTVGKAFHLTLGKMLQPAPSRAGDADVRYVNSAAVQWDGVSPSDDKTMWASPMERRLFSVENGDLLVCEGGDVGRAALYRGTDGLIFQNSVHRLRPRDGNDLRYLRYLLVSLHASGYLDVLCNKATIRHLTFEKFAALPIPLPKPDLQRKVADLLDDQVSRIDEICRIRTEQIEALDGRSDAAADVALNRRGWNQPSSLEAESVHPLPAGWRVARLSQVLRQLTNGYVGPTRDILVEEGIRYIQGMHIKGGKIAFDRRHFFVTKEWHAARPRIHLRQGDVLIVQTGDIGRVAVVPPSFGEASCHALQIARVHEHVLSGEYLGAFLGSSFGYHSLLSRATGALHPHLEGGIRSVPVIVPPTDVQAGVVAEVREVRAYVSDTQAEMHAQIALLRERKRALITAAVTGEFAVTTASGRGN